MDPIIAVFTLAVILFYFWTSFGVAKARGVSEIKAPAMTGHPQLERAVRVHYNMLEWLPIFLPTLWLFAYFVPAPYGRWGALALGIVWVVGRILYQSGYMIQALACIGLMLGAFGGAIWALTQGG
jgi:glutathione S-transferase